MDLKKYQRFPRNGESAKGGLIRYALKDVLKALKNSETPGQFLKMQYDNQPLGLWEDDPFYGESIDDIRDKQLLVYSDGLNEAENPQQELLGNARLLELMADTKSLTSQQVIEMLINAVEEHRAGADPNDDLTLMCLSIHHS